MDGVYCTILHLVNDGFLKFDAVSLEAMGRRLVAAVALSRQLYRARI
jgi:hypothetical protein